jgi:hypothetical protein
METAGSPVNERGERDSLPHFSAAFVSAPRPGGGRAFLLLPSFFAIFKPRNNQSDLFRFFRALLTPIFRNAHRSRQ